MAFDDMTNLAYKDQRTTQIAVAIGMTPASVREFDQRMAASSIADMVNILNDMGNKQEAIASAIAQVTQQPLWPEQSPFPKVVACGEGYIVGSNGILYAINPLYADSYREALDLYAEQIRSVGVVPATVVARVRSLGQKSSSAATTSSKGPDGEDVKDVKSLNDLLDRLVLQAAQSNASDIYLIPTNDAIVIRMKIDGEAVTVDRIKIDASERNNEHVALSNVLLNAINKQANSYFRETVDGAFMFLGVPDRRIKVRVAGLPATLSCTREPHHKYTLRLLGNNSDIVLLDDLKLPAYDGNNQQEQVRFLSENKNGIVLLTGPTSSGKTTTLTATLQSVTKLHPSKMIHTLEDPVEIFVGGVVHSQIEPTMSYAQGLKNLLRQAPDIILVGEIRDDEVALLATQAAQTGHLVFSTLHTNNSLGTFGRLRQLGVDDYDIADVTRGIMGQRLVKVVCKHCSQEAKWGDLVACRDKRMLADDRRDMLQRYATIKDNYDDLSSLPDKDAMVLIPSKVGCTQCNHTGYSGRRVVSELLTMSGELGDLLLSRASPSHMHWVARDRYGFVEMWDYAMYLINHKIISFDHAYAALGPRLGQVRKPAAEVV